MAKPKQKSPSQNHANTPRQYPPRPPASPPIVVNPIWLLKAVALTIAAALVCAWLTLNLLVYQGQWQLVLHPSTTVATIPASEPVHFGAAETGQPTLTGIWLPSTSTSDRTILFLNDGSGSLADNAATLAQLHTLPLNLLAFDYRGFGASTPAPHPTEQRMNQDAESALDYLINTRHLRPQTIVPYGAGLGASLATTLAARHPELPALILESPIPDVLKLAQIDNRAGLVPLRLFFHERFPLTPLATLPTPKLILTAGPSHVPTPSDEPSLNTLSRQAHSPVMTTHLLSAPSEHYTESIRRFLDQHLH